MLLVHSVSVGDKPHKTSSEVMFMKPVKKKTQLIFSHRLAKYLLKQGFPIIDLVTSKKTGQIMYCFKNSPALQKAMDEFAAEHSFQQAQ